MFGANQSRICSLVPGSLRKLGMGVGSSKSEDGDWLASRAVMTWSSCVRIESWSAIHLVLKKKGSKICLLVCCSNLASTCCRMSLMLPNDAALSKSSPTVLAVVSITSPLTSDAACEQIKDFILWSCIDVSVRSPMEFSLARMCCRASVKLTMLVARPATSMMAGMQRCRGYVDCRLFDWGWSRMYDIKLMRDVVLVNIGWVNESLGYRR